MSNRSSLMPLSQGHRFGPYEIVAPIGAGGRGEVYKTVDTRLGRTLAIKTLDGAHGERIQQEARATGRRICEGESLLADAGRDQAAMAKHISLEKISLVKVGDLAKAAAAGKSINS